MHKPANPTHDTPSQEKSGLDSEGPGVSMSPPAFQLMASDTADDPPVQRKASQGGMPSDLVNGFAGSTGHDLSDVNVHYKSDKPASVGAHAYAQGNDIHLASGQDKHLPHEAAHVVQQREGRVQANTSVSGMPVNDNKGLESEADSMGDKAMQMKADKSQAQTAFSASASAGPIQRYQVPIEGQAPQGTMPIARFIQLVEAEEAKFAPAEQNNTRLMISRIRKIFYNSDGWDDHLIPDASEVVSPYGEPLERVRSRREIELVGPIVDMVDTEYYPVDSSGQRPEIYQNQEVMLTDGTFCDLGHVFAGLDAYNHPDTVDGPGLVNIGNLGGTTWTGDLGSVIAEAQIDYANTDTIPTDAELQAKIDEYAPAQDMLGNIDAYAIAVQFRVGAGAGGQKVSDILREYYLGDSGAIRQSRRYTLFSTATGLQGWDGSGWINEPAMVEHWGDQVNDAAALYLGAGTDRGFFNYPGTGAAAVGLSMNGGGPNLVRKFFENLKIQRATEPLS